MAEDKISVIIPMYNASGCIEKCLSSMLKQTAKNLEVILVDDCSTDDTVQKAKKYPFKIIKLSKRLSPAGVRNYGVKNASGDILVFIDADVVLKPNSIEEIVRSLGTPDTEAVSGIYTQDTPQNSFFSQFQNLILIFRYELVPHSIDLVCSFFCAIKRGAFEAIGGFNEKMLYYEDIEIGKRLTSNGYHCKLEPKLKVSHLKFYNHMGLIIDYFKKTSGVALYIKEEGFSKKIKDNAWPLSTKIAFISGPCLLFSIFLIKFTLVPALLFFCIYHISVAPLLSYLIKNRNLTFGVKSYFVLFEIYLAIIAGFINGILKKRHK